MNYIIITFKDLLSESDFIQTHKSFIVTKYKVGTIIEHQINIRNYKITISARFEKSPEKTPIH